MKSSWVNAAAGGTKTKLNHPMVCGHPWPVDGEYADGSHWTPETHGKYAAWHGDVRDALKDFCHGPVRHRQILHDRFQASMACQEARLRGTFNISVALAVPAKQLTADEDEQIDAKVLHADTCRLHLIRMSGIEDPDRLMHWITGSVRLLRRLASAGFIPLPMSGTLP